MANFKKVLAFALSAAMVLTAVPAANVNAAKKVALSAKKGTIKVKKTKKVTIKNTKKANITKVTFKYSKKNIAKATWKKATANKITIKGLKAGKTKITATIKLKNKVAGKKTYKLTYTATVKKASTTPTVVAMTGVALSSTTPTVNDVLVATPIPADANDVASYEWFSGDNATLITTTVASASTASLTVTPDLLGKYLKVVATDTEGNKFEAATTAPVAEAKFVANVVAVDQKAANKVAITFDVVAKDQVKKELIKVERVDGQAVLPVTELSWSEDGKTVLATVASAFADKVDYQVSYDGGAATAFPASVGEVATVQILTASAEQNIKTKIDFALMDANNIDVTSAVKVDETVEVKIEAVDNADITSDTSKASQASVTMKKVGEKAKVTVTYAPAGTASATVAPAIGEVVCTEPKATVGKARFKVAGESARKYWEDGSNCAKFYEGSDATSVAVAVGDTTENLFFCAEYTDKAGEIISYDTYEVSSSNDDVMSVSIANGIDSGKYAQISVSGNTKGDANVLVKATKNGAAYTYTIPVKVIDALKLQSITATINRPTMSNAIDDDYFGTISVAGKWSDGTGYTEKIDYSTALVDKDKKTGLSANLVKVAGQAAAEDRGAENFAVNGNKVTAHGSKAQSYVIEVTTSDEDGKELKAKVSVTVKDLSQKAWNLSGDGAKMEYTVEYVDGSSNKLDVAKSNDWAHARLAATADNLFAGYVRNGENGVVVIGTRKGQYVAGKDAVQATKALKVTPSVTMYFTAVPKSAADGAAGNAYDFDIATSAAYTTTQATVYALAKTSDTVLFTANTPGAAISGYKFKNTHAATNATKAVVLITLDTGSAAKFTQGDYLTIGSKKFTLGSDAANTGAAASAFETLIDSGQTWDATAHGGTIKIEQTTASDMNVAPSVTISTSGASVKATLVTAGVAKVAQSVKFDEATKTFTIDTLESNSADEDKAVFDDYNNTLTNTGAGIFASSIGDGSNATGTEPSLVVTEGHDNIPEAVVKSGSTFVIHVATASAVDVKRVWEAGNNEYNKLFVVGGEEKVEGANAVPYVLGTGNVKATTATTICNVYVGVKYGNKYTIDGVLYNSAAHIKWTDAQVKENADAHDTDIWLSAWLGGEGINTTMIAGNTNYDEFMAKPGTYKVTFFYTLGKKDNDDTAKGTAKTAESDVTVTNSYVAPKVTVNKRTLDSMTNDDLRDALAISCDINNNESAAASFDDNVYKNDKTETSLNGFVGVSEPDGDKWTVTYVGVKDQGITFIVPVNASFSQAN